jgi:CHAT domain-containing protein/tetratricopeptide (TPR) repeat protein
MAFRDWFPRRRRKTTEELLATAREHAAASRFQESLSIYSKIRRRDRTPALMVEMARACLALEDDQRALSYANDAREAAGAAGSARAIAAAMCVQGEVLLRERRRTDAMSRFREAIAIDPECACARAALGPESPPPSRQIDTQEPIATNSGRSSVADSNESWARSRLSELDSRAEELKTQWRLGEALAIAAEAVQFARVHLGEESPRFATALNNLAAVYDLQGDYASAVSLHRQALELRRAALGEDHPDIAQSLNNLAMAYEAKGDLASAEPLQHQAVEVARAALGEDNPHYAISLHNLAALYEAKGDYAAAETLYRQALEVSRAALGEDHPNYAASLNEIACLYLNNFEYEMAEPLLLQALEIRRTGLGEAHPDYATSLDNLARLYESKGDYARAERLRRQDLETTRLALGEAHPEYATSLHNLAKFYELTGDYTRAEPLFRQALEVCRAALGEHHPSYASMLNSLGKLYWLGGTRTLAEPLLRQALEIRRIALGEGHPEYATSLHNMAAFHMSKGEYALAEPLLWQAAEATHAVLGKGRADASTSLNNLAELYRLKGYYEAAEPLHTKALEFTRDTVGEDDPSYAKGLMNLALLYAATDRFLDAWAMMARAMDVTDRVIGRCFSISSDQQRLVTLEQPRADSDVLLSLVCQFLSSLPGAVAAAAQLVLRRKALAAEAAAIERAALLGGKYPHLATRLEKLKTLRRQITQAAAAGPGPEGPAAHQHRLADWEARKDRWESSLAGEIDEMNIEQRVRAVKLRDVALILPKGATLVEFVRFQRFNFKAVRTRNEEHWQEWRYLAFVLFAGAPDNVRMIDLGEADPIDRMITEFRKSLSGPAGRHMTSAASQPIRPIPETVLATGQALRQAVFDPLVKELGGRHRLLLALDGDLTRLPFGVLPKADGRLLIEDLAISYLNCGRDLLRLGAARTGRSTKPLVAADPDFDKDSDGAPPVTTSGALSGRRARGLDESLEFPIKRLEGTRQEGEQIARMLAVKPWLEGDVLEGRLKAECHSPRILHLATHGFFLEDQHRELRHAVRRSGLMDRLTGGMRAELLGPLPENPLTRSVLILAGVNTWHKKGKRPLPGIEDGLLTAEDVTGLDLLATELVVLSACDTGLGEVHTGEGVFGLQRAFILAGAKTLIMSLWKVPDRETQELMVDLYRRILAGEGRAEALQQAQLAMKQKYADPYYWGAFVCLGEPGPLKSVTDGAIQSA